MTQQFGLTGQQYDEMFGGGHVPYPTYRCKATAAEPDREGRTHLCRKPMDHEDEKHVCICGRDWEPVRS